MKVSDVKCFHRPVSVYNTGSLIISLVVGGLHSTLTGLATLAPPKRMGLYCVDSSVDPARFASPNLASPVKVEHTLRATLCQQVITLLGDGPKSRGCLCGQGTPPNSG